MNRDDDTAEIIAGLKNNIVGVVRALYPNAVLMPGKAYCSAKSPKDLGSFQVNLVVYGRFEVGSWYRFSEQVGGGVINLVSYALTGRATGKTEVHEAFDWAREFLGIKRGEHHAAPRQAIQQPKPIAPVDDTKRVETARSIWLPQRPMEGTLVQRYLAARGVDPIPDPNIRYAPNLPYEGRGGHQGLVARVQAPDGAGRAVWRIWLEEPGIKANVPNQKMGLGPYIGGAVRLGGIGSKIGICEGIETAYACAELSGRAYPIWSCLCAPGVAAFEPPPEVDEIVIWPDGDLPMERHNKIIIPGMDAAEKLEKRMRACGIKVTIIDPPKDGDFLDLLVSMKKRGILNAQPKLADAGDGTGNHRLYACG